MIVFDCDYVYDNFDQKLLVPFCESMKIILSKTSTNKLIEKINTLQILISPKNKTIEPNP